MKKKRIIFGIPSVGDLKRELRRSRHRSVRRTIRIFLAGLVAVAALFLLSAALFWLPARKLSDHGMSPGLPTGSIVLTRKTQDILPGDVIAFAQEEQTLIRRVIAGPGDWVDLDKDGNIYVNNVLLEEPYAKDKAAGEADTAFPLQVSAHSYFVLCDNRAGQPDSRTARIGCVGQDQILGKAVLCIWPLTHIKWNL